jgi:hypothetical protein
MIAGDGVCGDCAALATFARGGSVGGVANRWRIGPLETFRSLIWLDRGYYPPSIAAARGADSHSGRFSKRSTNTCSGTRNALAPIRNVSCARLDTTSR